MHDNHITAYADAIINIAAAEGASSAIENELFTFLQAINGSDELRARLTDPKLPVAVRQQIVEDLLAGKAATATASILAMVIGNGRIAELPQIVDAVLARSAESRGEAVAEVRSAVALTDDQQTRLAAALTKQTGRPISVRNVVDPTVLGGIVTQIGDTLLDGSVRTRLTQLRDAF